MVIKRALAAVSLLLVAACSAPAPAAEPAPRVSPDPRRVADLFSPPPPYPGIAWTHDGRKVGWRELVTAAGHPHCETEDETFLHIAWPLGTQSRTAADTRGFMRAAGSQAPPPDARDTGYRSGDLELWISPADDHSVYLRRGTDVERWPRVDNKYVCS